VLQEALKTAVSAGAGAPPGTKIAAAAITMAAMAGYIAQVKAAQAQIPRREHGGGVEAGTGYRVGERGAELYTDRRGNQMMIPAEGGTVSRVGDTYGGSTYNVSVVINGGGDAGTVKQSVYDAILEADRVGVDWKRARGLMKAIKGA
jgi:hypothetical protein